jgi:hypothetical protein
MKTVVLPNRERAECNTFHKARRGGNAKRRAEDEPAQYLVVRIVTTIRKPVSEGCLTTSKS